MNLDTTKTVSLYGALLLAFAFGFVTTVSAATKAAIVERVAECVAFVEKTVAFPGGSQ